MEGRYYDTTNPGAYFNYNIMALLSLSYKFDQPEVAPPPPPPPVVAPPSFMVFFDWDRSNLSQQALNTIRQAAAAFKTKGNARITASGHTDTSGPEAYNMALSLRRANAVKDAPVREGVPAQAITVIGRGEQGLLVLHDQLATDRKIRVLTVVDTFSRYAPAIDPRLSYRGEDVVQVLEKVCARVGYPTTIRVDLGTEFDSRDLDLWAYTRGVTRQANRPTRML